jgi:hypothetical protein
MTNGKRKMENNLFQVTSFAVLLRVIRVKRQHRADRNGSIGLPETLIVP